MSAPSAGWRGIRDALVQRIAEREWSPGEMMPTEAWLAKEFGVARATVNRAMRDMAERGLVERRRKAGTKVASHPVRQARFSIPLVRDEIERRGHAYLYRLLDRRTAVPPEIVAARMGVEHGARLLHLRCLHLADGAPYQYEDRWIDPAVVPEAATQRFEARGPNEWLVASAPFSRAEFTFLAAAASAEEATLLQLAEGTPVFVGERLTWLAERAITLVRMVHPPSYRMVTRL